MPVPSGYQPDHFKAGDQVVSYLFSGTARVASVSAVPGDHDSVYVDADPPLLPYPFSPADLRKGIPAPVTMALAGEGGITVALNAGDHADTLFRHAGDLLDWETNSEDWVIYRPIDQARADQVLAAAGWPRSGRWVYDGEGGWTAVVRRA